MADQPTLTTVPTPEDSGPAAEGRPVIKRKEFFERIAESSGARKGEVRKVAAATLEAISLALQAGEDLNIPPLGRIKLIKERQTAQRQALTVRIVLNAGQGEDNEALADDDAEG